MAKKQEAKKPARKKSAASAGDKAKARATAEAANDEAVESGGNEPLITKKALNDLYRDDVALAGEIAQITGTKRQRIGDAVQNDHLDKDAYAAAKKIKNIKKAEKRASVVRNLLAYLRYLGLLKEVEDRPELPGMEAPRPRQFGGTVVALAKTAGAQVPDQAAE